MTNDDYIDYALWPCGSYCELGDIDDNDFMSDDYAIVSVPLDVEDVEDFMEAYLEGD